MIKLNSSNFCYVYGFIASKASNIIVERSKSLKLGGPKQCTHRLLSQLPNSWEHTHMNKVNNMQGDMQSFFLSMKLEMIYKIQ